MAARRPTVNLDHPQAHQGPPSATRWGSCGSGAATNARHRLVRPLDRAAREEPARASPRRSESRSGSSLWGDRVRCGPLRPCRNPPNRQGSGVSGKLAGVTGLEPAASGVTGQRSNQLSYTPAVPLGPLDVVHRARPVNIRDRFAPHPAPIKGIVIAPAQAPPITASDITASKAISPCPSKPAV